MCGHSHILRVMRDQTLGLPADPIAKLKPAAFQGLYDSAGTGMPRRVGLCKTYPRFMIDSLIRGWPFGPLLLWKVNHQDLEGISFRPFWTVVKRMGEENGAQVLQMNPPGEATLPERQAARGASGESLALLDLKHLHAFGVDDVESGIPCPAGKACCQYGSLHPSASG